MLKEAAVQEKSAEWRLRSSWLRRRVAADSPPTVTLLGDETFCCPQGRETAVMDGITCSVARRRRLRSSRLRRRVAADSPPTVTLLGDETFCCPQGRETAVMDGITCSVARRRRLRSSCPLQSKRVGTSSRIRNSVPSIALLKIF